MVRTRNRISKDGMVIIIVVLSMGINFSMNRIDVIDSKVSVTKSTSQNYTVRDRIIINNDVELAAVATSGMGTSGDPYIIADWNITSNWGGIYITGTTKHFRIEKCWINNSNGNAIALDLVPAGTASLINNFCTGYGWNGIYLRSSGSSIIANNTCTKISNGINLEDSESSIIANNTFDNKDGVGISLSDSGSSTVTNNICNDNGVDGIYLENSEFSKITDNTCNNCSIYLGDSESSDVINNTCNGNMGYGIRLWESSFSTITNNSCYDNGNGIELAYSDYSLIMWNKLRENGGFGLELSDSDNNSIHHNSFIQNGQNTSQACDDGLNNQWYDDTVLEGNYWSDYSGTGSYIIAGSADAYDLYPTGDPPDPNVSNEIDLSDFVFLLVRISLFLGILGVLAVSIFFNRRKKGF